MGRNALKWRQLGVFGGMSRKKRNVYIALILVYISGGKGLHEADIGFTFGNTGFTSPAAEVGWWIFSASRRFFYAFNQKLFI